MRHCSTISSRTELSLSPLFSSANSCSSVCASSSKVPQTEAISLSFGFLKISMTVNEIPSSLAAPTSFIAVTESPPRRKKLSSTLTEPGGPAFITLSHSLWSFCSIAVAGVVEILFSATASLYGPVASLGSVATKFRSLVLSNFPELVHGILVTGI